MQARVLDEYWRGEKTQAQIGAMFGITRSAVAQRLRRHRLRNFIPRRRPRPKHRRPVRFVSLSSLACC